MASIAFAISQKCCVQKAIQLIGRPKELVELCLDIEKVRATWESIERSRIKNHKEIRSSKKHLYESQLEGVTAPTKALRPQGIPAYPRVRGSATRSTPGLVAGSELRATLRADAAARHGRCTGNTSAGIGASEAVVRSNSDHIVTNWVEQLIRVEY